MTTTQPSDGGAATDPQALKILISTWNMGDSIPKGDLEVLYGKIPPYQPPPKPPTAGAAGGTLPDFGNTDGHPYHLIVIAAQECPTQSGVPRGIAAGVTKGMGGLREREKMKERERLRDAKERVKEMGKEMLGKEKPKDKDKEAKDMDSRGDAVVATDDSVSPITNQHTPHHGHHSVHVTVAARGWSDILEDYFCNGVQSHRKSKSGARLEAVDQPRASVSAAAASSQSVNVPPRKSQLAVPPSDEQRSASAPIPFGSASSASFMPSSYASTHLMNAAERALADDLDRRRSLSASPSSANSPWLPHEEHSSQSTPTLSGSPFHTPMALPTQQNHVSEEDHITVSSGLPNLVIPPSPSARSASSSNAKTATAGPYQFLIKERLLGLYIAIFVHRDCHHLVLGHDKDYVPAGLVGGRIGNKGGIGASLNIAGHRLLFVNSHLAAHTQRQGARLANIEKIRSELHVDCFLPETDPRKHAPELEDRFDTVFWFGDLNFRLDVSRLHADWLISRKEYQKALIFDQLRQAMQRGEVFAGYTEGAIDFPPTFKYDVWHSFKRSKSTRARAGSIVGVAGRSRKDKSALRDVKEGSEEAYLEAQRNSDEDDDEQSSDFGSTRRVSVDSSAWNSSVGFPTDVEDGEESDGEPNHTVKQPPRPITGLAVTSAIKAKHKFLQILRGSRTVTSSPAPSITGRRARATSKSFDNTPTGTPAESDHDSGLLPPPRIGELADEDRGSSLDDEDHPSASRRPSLHRQLSKKLKRRLSARHGRGGDSSDSSEGEQEDTREGVYDSSSKQRVPSWCDRVLWKTHVYASPVVEPLVRSEQDHPEGRRARLGAAISNVLQRRHRDRGSSSDSLSEMTAVSGDAGSHGQSAIAASPTTPHATLAPLGHPTTPSALSPIPPLLRCKVTSPSETKSSDFAAPSADSGIHRVLSAGPASMGRPRSNSTNPSVLLRGDIEKIRPAPRHFGGTHRSAMAPADESHGKGFFPRSRTIGAIAQDAEQDGDRSELHFFASPRKWFKDLPNLLLHHQRVSPDEERGEQAEEAVPKKQRGEVDCLRYSTLDDAGMRLLEGRSDHRPIIFAGVVYIQ